MFDIASVLPSPADESPFEPDGRPRRPGRPGPAAPEAFDRSSRPPVEAEVDEDSLTDPARPTRPDHDW